MASNDSTSKSRTRKTSQQRAEENVAKAQKVLDQASKRVERATNKVNAVNTELAEAQQAQSAAQAELDYAQANPALNVSAPAAVGGTNAAE